VNRQRRRADVRLRAERILIQNGEMGVAELSYRIDRQVTYAINPRAIGLILKDHPRIIRVGDRGSIASYRVRRTGNPQ
jgi:hypothetical protein